MNKLSAVILSVFLSAGMMSTAVAQSFDLKSSISQPPVLNLNADFSAFSNSAAPVTECRVSVTTSKETVSFASQTVNMVKVSPYIRYTGDKAKEVPYRITYNAYYQDGTLANVRTVEGTFSTEVSSDQFVVANVSENLVQVYEESRVTRNVLGGGAGGSYIPGVAGVLMVAQVDTEVCQVVWGDTPHKLSPDFALQNNGINPNELVLADPSIGSVNLNNNDAPVADGEEQANNAVAMPAIEIDPSKLTPITLDVLVPVDQNQDEPGNGLVINPEVLNNPGILSPNPGSDQNQDEPGNGLVINPEALNNPGILSPNPGGQEEPSFESCRVTGQALQEGNNVRIQSLVRYDNISAGNYRYVLSLKSPGIEGIDVYDGEIIIAEPSDRGYVTNDGQPFEFSYNVAETGNVFELSASINGQGCRGLEIVVVQADINGPAPVVGEDVRVNPEVSVVVAAKNTEQNDQDELQNILAALEQLRVNDNGDGQSLPQKPRRVVEEEVTNSDSEKDNARTVMIMVLGVVVGALLVVVIVLLMIMQKHKNQGLMMK